MLEEGWRLAMKWVFLNFWKGLSKEASWKEDQKEDQARDSKGDANLEEDLMGMRHEKQGLLVVDDEHFLFEYLIPGSDAIEPVFF